MLCRPARSIPRRRLGRAVSDEAQKPGQNWAPNGDFLPGHSVGKETRFGEPGGNESNPNGRPLDLWTRVRKEFRRHHEGDRTKADEFARLFMEKALANIDWQWVKETLDREEGGITSKSEMKAKVDARWQRPPVDLMMVDKGLAEPPPLPDEEEKPDDPAS